mgnify:CR=1 FL=1
MNQGPPDEPPVMSQGMPWALNWGLLGSSEAGPVQLTLIAAQTGNIRHRLRHQLRPLSRAQQRCRTMWRNMAGQQAYLCTSQVLVNLECRTQMAYVNRIEGATQQCNRALTELQQRTCPLPSTTNFWVVSPSRPTGPRA